MDNVLTHAESVLHQHPAPAMELRELHRRIHARYPVGMPTCPALRRLVESHPQRFRVLDPWDGSAHVRGDDEGCGVLVLALRPRVTATGRTPEVRLRESLRWVAGTADMRATRSSVRAYGLLSEGASAQGRLMKRAA